MPAASSVQRTWPRSDGAERGPLLVCHLITTVETHRSVEFVDITDSLSRAVQDFGLRAGVLTLHTRHTTTGLMVNEHEPLLLADLEALFERLVPVSAAYGHDDFSRRTVNLTLEERRNGHAHCRAALLRTSESVSIIDGRLDLGSWQRVFLVDFDGGQLRQVSLTLIGTPH